MDSPLGEYTYLAINAFTISYPLAQSFEKRIQLWRSWKFLLPAILITAIPFLIWDEWFTQQGVWGFNTTYISGIYIGSLPLEEWLFFLTVPYACTFIYEVLNYFFPKIPANLSWVPYLHWGIIILFLVVALFHTNRLYTFTSFLLAALWLSLHKLTLPNKYQYLLWRSYAVCLIPFLLVNTVLTALPVVWYNDSENLGIRLGTIPADDLSYNALLISMTYTFYEWFRIRANKKTLLTNTATTT